MDLKIVFYFSFLIYKQCAVIFIKIPIPLKMRDIFEYLLIKGYMLIETTWVIMKPQKLDKKREKSVAKLLGTTLGD